MPRAYLYPQNAVNEYPANLGSADAEVIVTAEDGMDYVVKTTRKHPAIPASEWICHNLADGCGIPTPQYTFIKLLSGAVGFGSQWDESGLKDKIEYFTFLNAIPGPVLLAKQFSAIYVFDLFVFNIDRHSGNYFFAKTNDGRIGVKAYDFSRALLYNGWPLPSLPMPLNNTVSCFRALQVGYPFDRSVANETLRRIAVTSVGRMEDWIRQMPPDWLSENMRADFLLWWRNGVHARIDHLSKGIANGSLL